MTTTMYLLNLGLLAFVLWANLGTRTVDPVPAAPAGAAGDRRRRGVPPRRADRRPRRRRWRPPGSAPGGAGAASPRALVRVDRNRAGRLVMRAGAAYAALWVAVIGGRMLFAYGAEHWFPAAIGRFSMTHQITGADAWTAAFILLSLPWCSRGRHLGRPDRPAGRRPPPPPTSSASTRQRPTRSLP